MVIQCIFINTLRTGDADLCFYVTTVQDGWRRFAFLTRWNSVHLQVCCICTNTVTRAGLGRPTTTVNEFSPAQVHVVVAEREQWTCTRGIYVYNSY